MAILVVASRLARSVVKVAAIQDDEIVKLHAGFMSNEKLAQFKQKYRRLQGDTIDALFDNRDQIDRIVRTTANGLEATTTSTNPAVVALIHTHVQEMESLERPIRQGDPLFVALFENIEQTHLNVEYTDDGVHVVHTGSTDCGMLLVQHHAAQVSSFVDTGDRRPNFDYQEPASCMDPQPLSTPASTTPPTTKSPTTMTPATMTPSSGNESSSEQTPTPASLQPTQAPTQQEISESKNPQNVTTTHTDQPSRSVALFGWMRSLWITMLAVICLS